jgi:hypothetical protein
LFFSPAFQWEITSQTPSSPVPAATVRRHRTVSESNLRGFGAFESPLQRPDHVVRTVTENGRTLKFTSQRFEVE